MYCSAHLIPCCVLMSTCTTSSMLVALPCMRPAVSIAIAPSLPGTPSSFTQFTLPRSGRIAFLPCRSCRSVPRSYPGIGHRPHFHPPTVSLVGCCNSLLQESTIDYRLWDAVIVYSTTSRCFYEPVPPSLIKAVPPSLQYLHILGEGTVLFEVVVCPHQQAPHMIVIDMSAPTSKLPT